MSEKELRLEHLQKDLEAIAATVKKTAQDCQGNNLELLALLRLLEALHQEVRDGLFQDSLPDNRQALYALLKDIENNGGWPHIYRMRLQHFLSNLLPEDEGV
jgi:chromosome segregation ATPase